MSYHILLIVIGTITAVTYSILTFDSYLQFSFVAMLPLFGMNIKAVKNNVQAHEIDPYLKQLALSTLLFVLLFGLGHIY